MAAMETLVNTVTGASLSGQQQETLKHVLFPEISVKEKRRGREGGTFLDSVKPHLEKEGVLITRFPVFIVRLSQLCKLHLQGSKTTKLLMSYGRVRISRHLNASSRYKQVVLD